MIPAAARLAAAAALALTALPARADFATTNVLPDKLVSAPQALVQWNLH